jgi:hypothetical protein
MRAAMLKPDEETRAAVLRAFQRARVARRDKFTCYRAAVDAWCAIHPDHNRTQAATQAVKVLQDSFGPLRPLTEE